MSMHGCGKAQKGEVPSQACQLMPKDFNNARSGQMQRPSVPPTVTKYWGYLAIDESLSMLELIQHGQYQVSSTGYIQNPCIYSTLSISIL